MPEDPFDRHFREHFDAIWRFARRRTATSADADDITAETFAVAWRRRDDLPPSDLRPWLFGVTRNVLLNHSRTIERQERLRLRVAQATPEEASADPANGADPTLWCALSALSADDRDLLMMRAWDELAVGEIATILGCTANAASVRLHKARTRLADELRRHEHEDSEPELAPRTAPGKEQS